MTVTKKVLILLSVLFVILFCGIMVTDILILSSMVPEPTPTPVFNSGPAIIYSETSFTTCREVLKDTLLCMEFTTWD